MFSIDNKITLIMVAIVSSLIVFFSVFSDAIFAPYFNHLSNDAISSKKNEIDLRLELEEARAKGRAFRLAVDFNKFSRRVYPQSIKEWLNSQTKRYDMDRIFIVESSGKIIASNATEEERNLAKEIEESFISRNLIRFSRHTIWMNMDSDFVGLTAKSIEGTDLWIVLAMSADNILEQYRSKNIEAEFRDIVEVTFRGLSGTIKEKVYIQSTIRVTQNGIILKVILASICTGIVFLFFNHFFLNYFVTRRISNYFGDENFVILRDEIQLGGKDDISLLINALSLSDSDVSTRKIQPVTREEFNNHLSIAKARQERNSENFSIGIMSIKVSISSEIARMITSHFYRLFREIDVIGTRNDKELFLLFNNISSIDENVLMDKIDFFLSSIEEQLGERPGFGYAYADDRDSREDIMVNAEINLNIWKYSNSGPEGSIGDESLD